MPSKRVNKHVITQLFINKRKKGDKSGFVYIKTERTNTKHNTKPKYEKRFVKQLYSEDLHETTFPY